MDFLVRTDLLKLFQSIRDIFDKMDKFLYQQLFKFFLSKKLQGLFQYGRIIKALNIIK